MSTNEIHSNVQFQKLLAQFTSDHSFPTEMTKFGINGIKAVKIGFFLPFGQAHFQMFTRFGIFTSSKKQKLKIKKDD